MNANHWLFSFRFTTLAFLFLICAIGIQGKPNTILNDCDINHYIAHLCNKWMSSSWPDKTSDRCIGHILLEWAYQMRGALNGDTTIKKNVYLDDNASNLQAKCRPSLKKRTNRSSSDALQDVFSLLLKLTNALKEAVDWCSLTAAHCQETYYNQTLSLVRTMNCLVRRHNGLDPNNRISYETKPVCGSW